MKIKLQEHKIAYLLILVLAALAVVSIAQGCLNAVQYSQDFQWDAASALVRGLNPYDESLHPGTLGLDPEYELYYKQMEANQFPSLLFLLWPYTLLPPLAARYAWLVSNLLFTALICFMLGRTFFQEIPGRWQAVLYLLMLAGTPWRNQMGVGQHTLFSFLFFLLAVWFTDRDRDLPAALCLFVCWFKYTLTVPLALYLVYKRRWKALILSVIPHVLLTVLASFLLHDSLINMILKPLRVASALSGEGSMDIGAMLGGGIFSMLLTLILLVGLLALAFLMPEGSDLLMISLLLLWSLIITYHRSYDYFVMILPFAWLYQEEKGKVGIRTGLYILLILGIFFGLRLFHESAPSLLAAGVCYYAYTAFVTVTALRRLAAKGK